MGMKFKKREVRTLSIRQKFMIIATICIVLVSATIGMIAYMTMENRLLIMAAEKAEAIGGLVAKQVDRKILSGIKEGEEESTQYKRVRQLLIDLTEASKVKYIYTLYTDGNTVYYKVDGDQSEEYGRIGEEFSEDYEFLKPVFEQGENLAIPELDTADGECLVTAYVPMIDLKGNVVAAVGVDCDATEFSEELQNLRKQMILIVAVGCVISILLLYIVTGRIAKSIKLVNNKLNELIHSDGDLTQTLNVRTGDEMEVMGSLINGLLHFIREIMLNVSNNSSALTDSSVAMLRDMVDAKESIVDVSATVGDSAKAVSSVAEDVSVLVDAMAQIHETTEASHKISEELQNEVKKFEKV